MSTGRWLWVCLQRYVMTGALGWVAAALILPVLGDDPFWASFGAGLGVGLIGVPLLTTVTMFVLVLLAGRRFEPPTGGPSRIRGGWLIVLPLVLLLPVALLVPLQYLIVLGAQFVSLGWVLPCQDARDTAELLRSLADPAVPAEQRARMARAVAGLRAGLLSKPWCRPRPTQSRRSPKRVWRPSAPSGSATESSARTCC